MFYSFKLKDTAKVDSKDWKGVTVNKVTTVYVESNRELLGQAEKAGIEAYKIATVPERNEQGNNVTAQRIA